MSQTERLQALKDKYKTVLPASAQEVMARAVKELQDSGQVGRALGEGAQAPAFSLKDQTGATVTLASLLQDKTLILSFYRGLW
jgi:hypothetical protein